LFGEAKDPLLWIGITLASFHSLGMILERRRKLKKSERTVERNVLLSIISRFEIPSGPGAESGFKRLIALETSWGEMET
jgi:hypothetical protein